MQLSGFRRTTVYISQYLIHVYSELSHSLRVNIDAVNNANPRIILASERLYKIKY